MHSVDFITAVENIRKGINAVLELKTPWWNKIGKVVELIVPEVEKFGVADNWSGTDKKQLAQDTIVELWFRYANQKYIPDFIERMLVNKISSVAIDKFVELMNKKGIFTHR